MLPSTAAIVPVFNVPFQLAADEALITGTATRTRPLGPNAHKAARGAGFGTIALSLAACGGGGGGDTAPSTSTLAITASDGTYTITPVPGFSLASPGRASVEVANDTTDNAYEIRLDATGSGVLEFTFADADDVVTLDARSDVTGFSTLKVVNGTLDASQADLGGVTRVEVASGLDVTVGQAKALSTIVSNSEDGTVSVLVASEAEADELLALMTSGDVAVYGAAAPIKFAAAANANINTALLDQKTSEAASKTTALAEAPADPGIVSQALAQIMVNAAGLGGPNPLEGMAEAIATGDQRWLADAAPLEGTLANLDFGANDFYVTSTGIIALNEVDGAVLAAAEFRFAEGGLPLGQLLSQLEAIFTSDGASLSGTEAAIRALANDVFSGVVLWEGGTWNAATSTLQGATQAGQIVISQNDLTLLDAQGNALITINGTFETNWEVFLGNVLEVAQTGNALNDAGWDGPDDVAVGDLDQNAYVENWLSAVGDLLAGASVSGVTWNPGTDDEVSLQLSDLGIALSAGGDALSLSLFERSGDWSTTFEELGATFDALATETTDDAERLQIADFLTGISGPSFSFASGGDTLISLQTADLGGVILEGINNPDLPLGTFKLGVSGDDAFMYDSNGLLSFWLEGADMTLAELEAAWQAGLNGELVDKTFEEITMADFVASLAYDFASDTTAQALI